MQREGVRHPLHPWYSTGTSLQIFECKCLHYRLNVWIWGDEKRTCFCGFFRLDKVRGLYAYVSPMCNGEIRTYVVLPKRGESLFLLFLGFFRSVSSSLLNVGDCETNTSLKKVLN